MTATAHPRIQKKRLQEELAVRFGPRFQAEREHLVGIVWPASEQELMAVVRAAAETSCPLIPRGAGSNAYAAWAGTHGLVVSFEKMSSILAVDQEQRVAIVQPGVVWQNLIDHLRPLGLMPRVYPSSGAVSTVGGFVAQGGAGIGSFEFGWVDETVESLRLIDGRGEAVELDHDDVSIMVGAEGRTGLFSEIRLRLQPLAVIVDLVGLFHDVGQLEACIASCARAQCALWSLIFIDDHAGQVGAGLGLERQPLLPSAHQSVLLSFRQSDAGGVAQGLPDAITEAGGVRSEEHAPHERWLGRFTGLQTIHTTPLPMQFRMPAGHMSPLIAGLPPDIRANGGFEGVAVGAGRELVVLFFLLSSGDSDAQNVEFAHRLTALAHTLGAVPYGTGAFFLEEATAVYGPDRLAVFYRFRAEHDPQDLLNPGRGFPTRHARKG